MIAGDADADDPDGDDPLVAFPAYGWRYRQATSVSRVAAEQQAWFDLINLDLKFREAAGLGAETVRRNQEQFAKRCWEQYQEVIDTNRRLARLKAASVLVRRIVDRHLAKLPADTALTLAEPLQPYVKSAGGPVVVDDLRPHGAPSSFATRALRRVSAKRPVAVEVAGRGRIRAFPVPAIPGDTTSDPIARNLRGRRRPVSTIRLSRDGPRRSDRPRRRRVLGGGQVRGRCGPGVSAFASSRFSRAHGRQD